MGGFFGGHRKKRKKKPSKRLENRGKRKELKTEGPSSGQGEKTEARQNKGKLGAKNLRKKGKKHGEKAEKGGG